MAYSYAGLRETYSREIEAAELKPSWQAAYDRAAEYILRNRAMYEPVEAAMGVPWQLVAALHWREASGSFSGVLHNGDKIIGTGRKTYRVPRGRGPFSTWTEAAIDAIKIKRMSFPAQWDMEGAAWFAEVFNGMGYRNKGRVSPYLWSGTTLYKSGKYVADGVYSSSAVDKQLGVMPLYQILLARTKPTSVPEVRRTSRKIALMDKAKLTLTTVVTTIGGWFTADNLGLAQNIFPALSGVFTLNTLITATVFAGGVWLLLSVLEKMIHQDAEEGRYVPSGQKEKADA